MADLDTLRPEVRECAATPHDQLILELMDSTIPKDEHGWAARREIETLRERAEKAEAELAALKARIEGAPSAEVWGVQGVAGLEPSYTVRETPAVVVTPLLSGKRVRLLVED